MKSASDCLELASDEVVLAAALGSNACPSRQPPAESLDGRRAPATSDERAFPGGSLQAGDRARTGDIQLGRLALYQLSYTRVRLA